jgi:ATP-dependent helicase HrpA
MTEYENSKIMKLSFPEHLAITEHLPAFRELIEKNQVVILSGSTGSGKTTQIPKALLSFGYGVEGLILHTQPRRIAVRNIAARLAQECEVPLGSEEIGYAVRFEERLSPKNRLQILTDGLLLAWLQKDSNLSTAEVVIIDEAHERSINIDLLLGFFKKLLVRRPELKLIIMSATIEADLFSNFFKQAPVLEINARTYPISYRYDPIPNDRDKFDHLVQSIKPLLGSEPGDFLVFFSGEAEIRRAALALRKANIRELEILPLYARLKVSEQQKIFNFSQKRRVILTTNVAETSLTVPNIRFVLDFGQARISRYNSRTKIQTLPIEAISKASCDQRAGRCGRIGPGICVRFYSLEDYQTRPVISPPEILRSNLAGVILQLLVSHAVKLENFYWLSVPEQANLREGWRLLEHLGAVDEKHRLTRLGSQLARLPIDPSLGRILLASNDYDCTAEALIIVSGLALPEILEQTQDQALLSLRLETFIDANSDFKTLLNLWEWIHKQKEDGTNRSYRQVLKDYGIRESSVREWSQSYRQLLGFAHQFGLKINEQDCDLASLHKSLLTGMLGGIGFKQEKEQYLGLRHLKFTLSKPYPKNLKNSQWVLAFELVETSKVYARRLAAIDPLWIEEVAAPLLKRHYGEPHWHEASMRVCAFEQVTLFGLRIVEKRRIDLAKKNPTLARELFIREGLVAGNLQTKAKFFEHNREFIEQQERQEARFRTRGLALDEDQQVAFYEQRLPANIITMKDLEYFLKQEVAHGRSDDFLCFKEEDFQDKLCEKVEEFPTICVIQQVPLELKYVFDPGSSEDGLCFIIPVLLLPRFESKDFSWLVPGLLEARIAALIKTLPKNIRLNLSPPTAFAKAAIERLELRSGDLLSFLAKVLSEISAMRILATDFREDALPEYLRPRFEIINEQQEVLCIGRDFNYLKNLDHLAIKKTQVQEKITSWEWTAFPRTQTNIIAGLSVLRYPALVDHGTHVEIVIFDNQLAAQQLHVLGVLRLIKLNLKNSVQTFSRSLVKQFKLTKNALALSRIWDLEAISLLWVELLFYEVFAPLSLSPAFYEKADFLEMLAQKKGLLSQAFAQMQALLPNIVTAFLGVQEVLKAKQQVLNQKTKEDAAKQLEFLFNEKTLRCGQLIYFARYPVYLAAMQKRLEKAAIQVEREQKLSAQILYLEKESANLEPEELAVFVWLLQELRVSLFAEQLGAKGGVSVQRLLAMIKK